MAELKKPNSLSLWGATVGGRQIGEREEEDRDGDADWNDFCRDFEWV